MFIIQLFVIAVYQPLLNILILFYWALDKVNGEADMGMAVILLTILVRFLLLPISLAGDKSEKDRRQMSQTMKQIERKYGNNPDEFKKQRKKLFKKNRGVVIGEMISLAIQVTIALSLWRVFAQGLVGKDFHLIYSWMPKVSPPFNLMFLGEYSLNEPHWQMNLLQSFLIFVLETISLTTSPWPVSRGEVIRMQLTLPLLSFVIFSMMPAGKKLFVIVTLCFSIVLVIFKFIRRRFLDYKVKKEDEETKLSQADNQEEEKVVVTIK